MLYGGWIEFLSDRLVQMHVQGMEIVSVWYKMICSDIVMLIISEIASAILDMHNQIVILILMETRYG